MTAGERELRGSTAIEPIALIDVSARPILLPEQKGKRAKAWVEIDGVRWLRKERWDWRPFEHVIEAFTLRLARALGLEAPDSSPCTWTDDLGAHEGIVIRTFLENADDALTNGDAVLRGVDANYDLEDRSQHALARVRHALESWESKIGGARLIAPFIRMLAFDAWIGNSDRHQQNWSLIQWTSQGNPQVRMAPVYDTAACLGAELPDGAPLLAADDVGLKRYIVECRSGFGPFESKKLLQRQEAIVREIGAWPEWASAGVEMLERIDALMDGSLGAYLASLDASLFQNERKEFVARVLKLRRERLKELT